MTCTQPQRRSMPRFWPPPHLADRSWPGLLGPWPVRGFAEAAARGSACALPGRHGPARVPAPGGEHGREAGLAHHICVPQNSLAHPARTRLANTPRHTWLFQTLPYALPHPSHLFRTLLAQHPNSKGGPGGRQDHDGGSAAGRGAGPWTRSRWSPCGPPTSQVDSAWKDRQLRGSA